MNEQTKPVKINAQLHYILKLYAAKRMVTITDLSNEALTEYLKKNIDRASLVNEKKQGDKPVKINAELHNGIKVEAAKLGSGITMTTLLNAAISEFIEKHNINEIIKNI